MIYRSCPHCSSERPVAEKFCGFCGQALPFVAPQDLPQAPQVQQPTYTAHYPEPRPDYIQKDNYNPAAAMICACFVVGSGQMINGQIGKGICLLVGAIILAPMTSFVGTFALGVLALIDAAMIAARLRNGQAVSPWQWF